MHLDDDVLRNVMADQMACSMLVEILLVQYLNRFSTPEDRLEIVEAIRRSGRKTDHFAGRASTEALAELLADVTVRMHSALDGYLERALARLG